jgi:hypothetical protein
MAIFQRPKAGLIKKYALAYHGESAILGWTVVSDMFGGLSY